MSFTPTDKLPFPPRKFWLFLYTVFLLVLFGMFALFLFPAGLLAIILFVPLFWLVYINRNRDD